MKRNKILTMILSIGIIVVVVGVSYAFFAYGKTGLYTHTINGGKMSVIYDEVTGNNITIDNAYPLTDEEALTQAMEFEFTITGYNESEKNVYYQIEMDHGSDVAGKNRFLDSDMKISLFENNNLVYENQVFDNLDNQSIHYGYINYGTSSASPVTNSYLLRIWINDDVFITNTPEEFETTGKSVYSTDEFANSYGNFKVNVIADLTYDEIGYLTYDANGGEFTPNKTSLTTGKVTTQKPVMANKGFLGWSSDRNATLPEYLAGDTYTGSEQVLYAVYGTTRNVMGTFSENILNYVGSGEGGYNEVVPTDDADGDYIIERLDAEVDYTVYTGITKIYFINDTQENIDARYNAASVKSDLTYNNQGSVKAWLEEGENTYLGTEYTLYIGAEGTIYLTDCVSMFEPFGFLYYLDLGNADSSEVTDMTRMFANVGYYDEGLKVEEDTSNSIYNKQTVLPLAGTVYSPILLTINNLPALNTANVIDMFEMFKNCNASELDMSGFNTSNVIDMSYMFAECWNLFSLELNSFDTRNVVDMSRMFSGCEDLMSLDIKQFKTKNVENMESMFYFCLSLNDIDLDNFNTENVINMSRMFYHCNNLESLDLSNFDTNKVTSMLQMFRECYNLKNLNINNFNTTNVTDMQEMFKLCNSLENLNINSFDTSNVTDMDMMFADCRSLKKLNVSHFDTSNLRCVSNTINGVYGGRGIFSGCESLEELDLSNWNTTNITNMNEIFSGCKNLKKIDLNNWDTSNVTNMSNMFNYCNNLIDININKIDTSNVTDMSYMFFHCASLKDININNFDTTKVKDMSNMFAHCYLLDELDLSNFETNSLEMMSGMFMHCESLVEIDISHFDTSRVTEFTNLFRECINLVRLDLSNLNTSSLTNIGHNVYVGMFNNCVKLEYLNISSFNFSKFRHYEYAFLGMPSTATIYVGSEADKNIILGISTSNHPAWTTDNIIVKQS